MHVHFDAQHVRTLKTFTAVYVHVHVHVNDVHVSRRRFASPILRQLSSKRTSLTFKTWRWGDLGAFYTTNCNYGTLLQSQYLANSASENVSPYQTRLDEPCPIGH